MKIHVFLDGGHRAHYLATSHTLVIEIGEKYLLNC